MILGAVAGVAMLFGLSLAEPLLGATMNKRLPKAAQWWVLGLITVVHSLVAPNDGPWLPEGIAVAAVAMTLLSGLRPGLLLVTGWWVNSPSRPRRLRIRAEFARWGSFVVVIAWLIWRMS